MEGFLLEEIPRKKSKTEDSPKWHPYYCGLIRTGDQS
jgi:hypothetical protein